MPFFRFAPMCLRVWIPNGATFSKRVVGTVISDASGNFSFSDVPVGNFEIYAYRQSTWQETRVSGERKY